MEIINRLQDPANFIFSTNYSNQKYQCFGVKLFQYRKSVCHRSKESIENSASQQLANECYEFSRDLSEKTV